MKFLYTISAAALATLVSAQIKSGGIGIQVLRTGTPVHLASVDVEGTNIFIGQGTSFAGQILPDGRIRTGGTDSWLTVNSDGKVIIGTPPLTWGVDDGFYLTVANRGFVAVPEGNAYSIYTVPLEDGAAPENSIPIALRVLYDDEFETSTSATAHHNSTATITSAPTGGNTTATTGVPVVTEWVTKCDAEGVCTTHLPQVNAAASLGSFAGAAAAVVGAALFL